MFLNDLCQLIILFFVFSCIGWLTEVVLKYIQFHRFINRGFLIGPYCPIYGWGVVAVTILVGGIVGREGTIGEMFLAGFFICGILEYFTSWYMEKLFHARWWDYSNKPMNLNGRIWIGNLMLFGIASVVIVHFIDPWFFALLDRMPKFWLHMTALMILVLIISDYSFSHVLMNIVKKEIDAQDGDNTDEISIKIHELLRDKNLLVRRIHEAYPDLQARPKKMMQEFKSARKEFKAYNKKVTKLMKEKIREQKKLHFINEKLNERYEKTLEKRKKARQKFQNWQNRIKSHKYDD